MLRKLKDGLSKTRKKFQEVLLSTGFLTDKDFEKSILDFEETLLTSDVGVKATNEIINRLREERNKNRTGDNLTPLLSEILVNLLNRTQRKKKTNLPPHTILMVGVNGTGKTTTLAKLAKNFSDKGEKVLMVASDTYRAAGAEQLYIWGKKIGVDVLKSQPGQDPASVAYDSIESSLSKGYSAILIDTAGRLHTKKNLMEELKKIKKVLNKKREDLPQDILLVLDATTGQNALSQANIFNETLGVTGIILTKIDGTAKGGIVFAISLELGIPIEYIGIGEEAEDLIEFNPTTFVESLLEGVFVK